MPSDVQLKVMNTLHKVVLKASFGKIGGNLLGMPAFELITTGRKSGQPRSVMLTSPYAEGDTVAIVASKGGNDEHPAWYLNLRDDPAVEVGLFTAADRDGDGSFDALGVDVDGVPLASARTAARRGR